MEWVKPIKDVLSAYRDFLSRKYGDKTLKRFNHLYESKEEAALSEAIIFNWLYGEKRNPELKEDRSTGGADFICNPDSRNQFIVEVTCLGREALAEATGCHMHPGQPMWYTLPTRMLWQRVNDKAKQLANYPMPRVLAITSLHDSGYLLLNPEEANNFLLSDWAFTFPLGGGSDDTYLSTDLKKAIFFKLEDGNPPKVVPRRKSVSAVLLVPMSGDRLNVTGVLHPEPTYPLNIHLIPKVPFLRIKDWPIQTGEIFTEWVISEPYAASFSLFPTLNR